MYWGFFPPLLLYYRACIKRPVLSEKFRRFNFYHIAPLNQLVTFLVFILYLPFWVVVLFVSFVLFVCVVGFFLALFFPESIVKYKGDDVDPGTTKSRCLWVACSSVPWCCAGLISEDTKGCSDLAKTAATTSCNYVYERSNEDFEGLPCACGHASSSIAQNHWWHRSHTWFFLLIWDWPSQAALGAVRVKYSNDIWLLSPW